MLPPSSTILLQMAAAHLIIHLGVMALPPVPTHAMPLLQMVRKVPTNQQQQDQGQTGNVPARMLASLKELKEMWKQYMKTPFSGQPPTRAPPSPKPQAWVWAVARRELANRQDTFRSYCWLGRSNAWHGLPQQQQQQQANTQYGGHASYSCMHNHTDDLCSYEQAVLTCRVLLMLYLAPWHCGNTTSTDPAATATMPPPPGKGNRASPARVRVIQ